MGIRDAAGRRLAAGRLAGWLVVGGALVVGATTGGAEAQSVPTSAPAAVRACGAMKVNFDVSSGNPDVATSGPGDAAPAPAAPAGKALVYVLEDAESIPLNRTTFRIGADGTWVGATRNEMYTSFAVDPGVHHLCIDMQGWTPYQLEKGISLRRLKAEAGKTYYLRVRMVEGRGALPLVLIEAVDEDEGQFLLETMPPAVWHAKK